MMLDISSWSLVDYHVWGLFSFQPRDVIPPISHIFKFCANLNAQEINVTILSGRWLLSPNQAYLASYFAAKGMAAARNIAKDLGMETLLYLSGQNQISAAKVLFGISEEQKSGEYPWLAAILTSSEASFADFLDTLEQFLGTSMETGQNWTPVLPLDDIKSALELPQVYLDVMSQVASDIPLLPALPASMEENGIMQALLERMVMLSLGQAKMES
jgi:hypothetical protein